MQLNDEALDRMVTRKVTIASAVAATAVLVTIGSIVWMGYAQQWALLSAGAAIGFMLAGIFRGGD